MVRLCGTDFGTNKSSGPKSVLRTVKNKILYQKSVQRTVPIRTDGTAVHGPDFIKNLDLLCPDFCLILDFSLDLIWTKLKKKY